jgi:hypothetical protein
MGNKIKPATDGNGKPYRQFRCPGCDDWHHVTDGWTWNDSLEKPTFNPSVRVTYRGVDPDTNAKIETTCHFYVREGKIEYLADCTHKMAGQTVEMLDVESG